MKIVIDIPDNYKERLDSDFDNLDTGSIGCTSILMAVKEGVSIPNNATNGDVIKAMFPSTKIRWMTQSRIGITVKNNQDYITEFELDWWNAPYNV